jgi:ribosome-binding protein aMBF1 (putative translation factor)
MPQLAIHVNPIRRPRKPCMVKPTPMEEQFYRDLISSLIAARHRRGITQEKLCEVIGVSDGLVNKWESGARLPSSFYLMCWCVALGLKLTTERTDGKTSCFDA